MQILALELTHWYLELWIGVKRGSGSGRRISCVASFVSSNFDFSQLRSEISLPKRPAAKLPRYSVFGCKARSNEWTYFGANSSKKIGIVLLFYTSSLWCSVNSCRGLDGRKEQSQVVRPVMLPNYRWMWSSFLSPFLLLIFCPAILSIHRSLNGSSSTYSSCTKERLMLTSLIFLFHDYRYLSVIFYRPNHTHF